MQHLETGTSRPRSSSIVFFAHKRAFASERVWYLKLRFSCFFFTIKADYRTRLKKRCIFLLFFFFNFLTSKNGSLLFLVPGTDISKALLELIWNSFIYVHEFSLWETEKRGFFSFSYFLPRPCCFSYATVSGIPSTTFQNKNQKHIWTKLYIR